MGESILGFRQLLVSASVTLGGRMFKVGRRVDV